MTAHGSIHVLYVCTGGFGLGAARLRISEGGHGERKSEPRRTSAGYIGSAPSGCVVEFSKLNLVN